MAAVELRGVTKAWGETRAVDGVSFRVEPGHLVALLGPSGCGKSTTLRLIAGLEEASEGVIHIAGRDVTQAPPAGRGIAMVFQNYALFPHLTVAENIVFGLRVRALDKAEREARLKEAAAILGLGKLLDRKPSQLSGGQQQRVALGRAIVARAPVCLMDEPLSNLDAQLRVEMRREIRDLQRRLGITMVYVTHDQVEAMTMADQVILMREGKIEQDGSPADLYERPETIFVARFVGAPPMNVVPLAGLEGAREAWPAPPDGLPLARAALGVRAEHLEIGEGGLPADVVAVEYLGGETLVEASIGPQRVIARRPGKVLAQQGERIGLHVPAGTAHWFDVESGRRVAGPP
jgi:sn-glycerol 3-phosphate transport system ATP-binding protein